MQVILAEENKKTVPFTVCEKESLGFGLMMMAHYMFSSVRVQLAAQCFLALKLNFHEYFIFRYKKSIPFLLSPPNSQLTKTYTHSQTRTYTTLPKNHSSPIHFSITGTCTPSVKCENDKERE